MSKPLPPGALSDAGTALWVAVVDKYDLRVDELAVLEGACRAADMVAGLRSVWNDEGRPMYTTGSMGQLVEHPAPKGIRTWQAAMDAALARLKLPDEQGGGANQQRDAAQSRWAQAHGKGA